MIMTGMIEEMKEGVHCLESCSVGHVEDKVRKKKQGQRILGFLEVKSLK